MNLIDIIKSTEMGREEEYESIYSIIIFNKEEINRGDYRVLEEIIESAGLTINDYITGEEYERIKKCSGKGIGYKIENTRVTELYFKDVNLLLPETISELSGLTNLIGLNQLLDEALSKLLVNERYYQSLEVLLDLYFNNQINRSNKKYFDLIMNSRIRPLITKLIDKEKTKIAVQLYETCGVLPELINYQRLCERLVQQDRINDLVDLYIFTRHNSNYHDRDRFNTIFRGNWLRILPESTDYQRIFKEFIKKDMIDNFFHFYWVLKTKKPAFKLDLTEELVQKFFSILNLYHLKSFIEETGASPKQEILDESIIEGKFNKARYLIDLGIKPSIKVVSEKYDKLVKKGDIFDLSKLSEITGFNPDESKIQECYQVLIKKGLFFDLRQFIKMTKVTPLIPAIVIQESYLKLISRMELCSCEESLRKISKLNSLTNTKPSNQTINQSFLELIRQGKFNELVEITELFGIEKLSLPEEIVQSTYKKLVEELRLKELMALKSLTGIKPLLTDVEYHQYFNKIRRNPRNQYKSLKELIEWEKN